MTYRFKFTVGSRSKVLRRAGTAMALTNAIFLLFAMAQPTPAADKLIGIHSARVLSQSMPWVATEAGLFKKYNLDFDLVFIASSPSVTAAMLGGDAEISLGGGEGPIRAYVQGASDFVFVGGFKNVLTHSILARPDIKRPADLKGKKVGINRVGSNPHYFAVQALRRSGIEPAEVNFIQSGGAPETLVALLAGGLDAASLNPPTDAASDSEGASLRHLWTRSPSSLRGNSLLYSQVACRKASAGCRAVSQSDGGGGQNHSHRQGICLQGHGKVPASIRQKGP